MIHTQYEQRFNWKIDRSLTCEPPKPAGNEQDQCTQTEKQKIPQREPLAMRVMAVMAVMAVMRMQNDLSTSRP